MGESQGWRERRRTTQVKGRVSPCTSSVSGVSASVVKFYTGSHTHNYAMLHIDYTASSLQAASAMC